MASISVREATLGRSSGATKAVRSAAKAIGRLQARLPLTVRGVRVVLRSTRASAHAKGSGSHQPGAPLPDDDSRQPQRTKQAPAQHGISRQGGRPGGGLRSPQKLGWLRRLQRWLAAAARAAWRAACGAVLWLVPALQSVPSRLLAGIAVQCACALLSVVPVRFKDVQLAHQVTTTRPYPRGRRGNMTSAAPCGVWRVALQSGSDPWAKYTAHHCGLQPQPA